MNATIHFKRFEEKYKRRGRLRHSDNCPGAQIYQIIDKTTQEERSMKVLKKSKCTYLEFLQEVSILKQCNGHPNLLDVHDVYEDYRFYYIVTDNLNHPTLYQSLKKIDTPTQVGIVLRTLLNALVFLHDPENQSKLHAKQIVHGKIHPKSILVPKGASLEQLLLVDFSEAEMDLEGLVDESQFVSSEFLEENSENSSSESSDSSSSEDEDSHQRKVKSRKKKNQKGGSHFHPPEYKETGPTPEADVFAFGVLAFLLFTGHYPFKKPSDTESPIKEWYDITQPEIQQFLQCLLAFHPRDRVTAPQANKSITWQDVNFGDSDKTFQQVMERLANIRRQHEFQVAVRSYIATNYLAESDQERLIQVFRRIDFQNNNTLSEKEFQRAMMETDMDIPKTSIAAYFRQLDPNGDRRIGYNEFMAFAAEQELLLERKNLKAAFDDFDWSNTGYITADDLMSFSASAGGSTAFRSAEGGLSKAMVLEMIQKADRKGDGKISFQEFADMMTQKRQRPRKQRHKSSDSTKKTTTAKEEKKTSRKSYYAKMLHRGKKR